MLFRTTPVRRRRPAPRRRPPRKGILRAPVSRRRGARRRGRASSWRRAALRWTAIAAGAAFLVFAAVTGYFVLTLPTIDRAAMVERRPAVTVLAADGARIHRFGELVGDAVSLEDLPPHLIHAVLATEDRRFYWHPGIDPIGIARAALANLRAGRAVQGGSTITQQLAKNLFLSPERTLRRKFQEALLAVWLEIRFSKDEILAAYLNRVYMGAGTYGVDAAARTYFGVPATSISLEQSAILAGLLKAPSVYAPTHAVDLAEERADLVLAAMVDEGYVTEADIERADSLPPLPQRRPGGGDGSRYFADWVAGRVTDFVGYDQGDLVVRSTLNTNLQLAAERIVGEHLANDGAAGGVGQAAVVALTPTGEVLAMVGGRAYGSSQFNRAVQAQRQPGSAFKPIIYLAALERGLRPDMLIVDAPIEIAGWAPRNFDDTYRGEITAVEALADSVNSASVRVLEWTGVEPAIDVARRLGITTDLRRDLSLALGTSEVTLLELTAAYAAFVNNGTAVWPHAIRSIEGLEGEPLYQREGGGPGEVVRPWHIWELDRMLQEVMISGTGRGAQLDRPAAGKTGTSQEYRDAWFVGFTADLVVGVWVGNDDGTPMNGVTGGGLPARIWRDVMLAAHRDLPPRPLPGIESVPVAAVEQPSGFQAFLDSLFGG